MPPAARLETLVIDAAARIVQWDLGDVPRMTPLAFAVHAPHLPAPEGTLVLTRTPLADRPSVLTGGSRFQPGAKGQALVTFDDDLPYAPAGGGDLVKAAHEDNVAHHTPGNAFILTDPSAAVPDDVEVVALANARAIFDNPYTFAKAITTARANIGPERLLYLPGCGLPNEIALLAYAGVDLFDDVTAVMAARGGAYVTAEGSYPAKALESTTLATDDLVAEARAAVQHEIARVQVAIRAGKLRELVEMRSRSTPALAAHLRRFDKETTDFFLQRAPLLRAGPLYATAKESIERPEIERYRRRIHSRYRKPTSARVLVLLPCSATKPYSLSKTHRILASALGRTRNPGVVHEVILTSPLGVVPRELEEIYPAAHYDLPVTGHWDEDERAMIRDTLTALLARSKYDSIIVHLDEVEMGIAAPVLGEFIHTAIGDPLSPDSLENLRQTIDKVTDPMPSIGWRQRALDDMSSLAQFQFGEAGHALVEGAEVKGRKPYLKLVDTKTGKQLAMTTPDRGYFSLAPEGGARLMETGRYRVEIENFRPKGTIFAVGVKNADPEIVPEDDVIIHHAGEYRGVGRAMLPGVDMGPLKRGGCVNVRHKGGDA